MGGLRSGLRIAADPGRRATRRAGPPPLRLRVPRGHRHRDVGVPAVRRPASDADDAPARTGSRAASTTRSSRDPARPRLAAGSTSPARPSPFARECGAFLVESNQGFRAGGPRPDDPSILTHRANAAVARSAAGVAHDHYGTWPEHAYLVGGSGGGLRTMLALEHVEGLWDGGVPYFIGQLGTDTNGLVADARRLLRDDVELLVRLADGDGWPELSAEQRRSLDALLDARQPPRRPARAPRVRDRPGHQPRGVPRRGGRPALGHVRAERDRPPRRASSGRR